MLSYPYIVTRTGPDGRAQYYSIHSRHWKPTPNRATHMDKLDQARAWARRFNAQVLNLNTGEVS